MAFFSSGQFLLPMLSVPLNAMCSNICAMPVAPDGIVDRPGVHIGVKRYHRRLMPLDDDEVQAIGEGELCDFLLELMQVLRRQEQRQQKDSQAMCPHVLSSNLADSQAGTPVLRDHPPCYAVMRMFSRQRRKARFLFGLSDILLTALAFEAAYRTRSLLHLERIFYIVLPSQVLVLGFTVGVWLLTGLWLGVYERLDAGDPRVILRDSFRQCAYGAVALVLFEFVAAPRPQPSLPGPVHRLRVGACCFCSACFRAAWPAPFCANSAARIS